MLILNYDLFLQQEQQPTIIDLPLSPVSTPHPTTHCNYSLWVHAAAKAMTSLQSVAFLHITLVTIGVIVFGALFQNKCAYILELTEQRYNDTLEEVHRQNTAATEDHRTCMENNGRGIVEIGDLQGRLDGQTTLSRKYQHLLQEHEPVKEKVGELLTELKRKEQELNQQFQLHSDQRNDLIGQLDSQRQELDEALKINQKLVEEMIAETRNEREEHETTQRRVQQRHNSLCKQR